MVCGRVRAVLTVTRRVLGRCPRGGAPCERVDQVQTVDEGALKARSRCRGRGRVGDAEQGSSGLWACECVDRAQAVDEGALKARWVARSRVVSRQQGCAFAGELHECKLASSIDNGRIKLCVLKKQATGSVSCRGKKCGPAVEICGSGTQRKNRIATHLLLRKC